MADPNIEVPATAKSGAMRQLRAALRKAVGIGERQSRRRRRVRRLKRWRASLSNIDVALHWERMIVRMLRLGWASAGNRVRLFCDGDEAMEAIWSAIDGAKRRVWLETYILEPDRVGWRTIEALANAAKRGCEVILLYDAVGGSRVTEALLAPLRSTSAEIFVFNPLWRWRRTIPLLRRDHRKIVVIDDTTAFCGGMNFSEDYAGPRNGNGRFRDCHVQLDGPCVRDLGRVFLSSLKHVDDRRWRLPHAPKPAGDTFVQVLASSGRLGRRAIQRAMRLSIRKAVRHCYITTPYFIPSLRLMWAINRAARRGVDVRILTAGDCDVPIVRTAAQHIYGHFLRHGVRIFEMFDSTLHAKTVTIDGLYSIVGSFNLDTWSDKRNLEVCVAMVDPAIAHELEEQFLAAAEKACEVTLDTWGKRSLWQRACHWCAYQVMRL